MTQKTLCGMEQEFNTLKKSEFCWVLTFEMTGLGVLLFLKFY